MWTAQHTEKSSKRHKEIINGVTYHFCKVPANKASVLDSKNKQRSEQAVVRVTCKWLLWTDSFKESFNTYGFQSVWQILQQMNFEGYRSRFCNELTQDTLIGWIGSTWPIHTRLSSYYTSTFPHHATRTQE